MEAVGSSAERQTDRRAGGMIRLNGSGRMNRPGLLHYRWVSGSCLSVCLPHEHGLLFDRNISQW